jgi:hypothetical protein
LGRKSDKQGDNKKLKLAVEVSALGLDCHNCNEHQKKFRGCFGKPVQPYLIDGKPADRCIAKVLPIEIKEYIRYYELYKKGNFLDKITDYPAKLLDIFDVLESAEIEMMRQKYKV